MTMLLGFAEKMLGEEIVLSWRQLSLHFLVLSTYFQIENCCSNTAPIDADLNNGSNSGFGIGTSLIGDVGSSSIADNGGNQLGGDGSPVIDPLLKPLADNGGATETHALQSDSSAINSGNNAICTASPVNGVDQRGNGRPQGTTCDMGAFELGSTLYLPIIMNAN